MIRKLCCLVLALSLVGPVWAGDITGSVTAVVDKPLKRKFNKSRKAKNRQKSLYDKAGRDGTTPGSDQDGGLTEKELAQVKELDYVVVFLTSAGDGAKLPVTKKAADLLQKQRIFQKHVTPVTVGSMVNFKNGDRFEHDIYSPRKSSFRVGPHGRGANKPRLAEGLGAHEIFCNIHTLMNAYIYVCPNDFYTMPTEGQFTLKDVPPGTYELKAWHPRLGEKVKTVTVSDGPLRVEVSL